MSDKDRILRLVELSSNDVTFQDAQRRAARKLLDFDGEVFPSDGCAIMLSTLLQDAGIMVRDTFKAIELGQLLENERNWQRIPIGEQRTGDVGSTCGSVADHGRDHIYLIVTAINPVEMLVADNQDYVPHTRFTSGHGKSDTRFFLRAS